MQDVSQDSVDAARPQAVGSVSTLTGKHFVALPSCQRELDQLYGGVQSAKD